MQVQCLACGEDVLGRACMVIEDRELPWGLDKEKGAVYQTYDEQNLFYNHPTCFVKLFEKFFTTETNVSVNLYIGNIDDLTGALEP